MWPLTYGLPLNKLLDLSPNLLFLTYKLRLILCLMKWLGRFGDLAHVKWFPQWLMHSRYSVSINIQQSPVLSYSWSHSELESSPELCRRASGNSGKIAVHIAIRSIYSFTLLLNLNLLSFNLHKVKCTNLMCSAQWINIYPRNYRLDHNVDYFQHPGGSLVPFSSRLH